MKSLIMLMLLISSTNLFASPNGVKVGDCGNKADILHAVQKVSDSPIVSQRSHNEMQESLIQIRRKYAKQIERKLNDPSSSALSQKLKSFIYKMNRNLADAQSENDVAVGTLETYIWNSETYEKLQSALNDTQSVSTSDKNETEIKQLDLRTIKMGQRRNHQLLFQDGKFHLPFSFKHFAKDDQSRLLQYQFELAIEFRPDGSLTVTDSGNSTALAFRGKCDKDSVHRPRNDYFRKYSNAMFGECTNEGKTFILRKDQLAQENLLVKFSDDDLETGELYAQNAINQCDPLYRRNSNLMIARADSQTRIENFKQNDGSTEALPHIKTISSN
jgi:hypothetical protein